MKTKGKTRRKTHLIRNNGNRNGKKIGIQYNNPSVGYIEIVDEKAHSDEETIQFQRFSLSFHEFDSCLISGSEIGMRNVNHSRTDKRKYSLITNETYSHPAEK